jgi:hypothetical protein
MYCSTDGTVGGATAATVAVNAFTGDWECDDGSTVVFATAGPNTVDECGTCDADPSNDCVLDCLGNWGGTAFLAECVLPNGSPFTICGTGSESDLCEGTGGYAASAVTALNECTTAAIASIDHLTNTVTLPAIDTTIVAGQKLQLDHAAGRNCAASGPGVLRTPLEVISAVGAVITFATDIQAGGTPTDCVLKRQVDPCAALMLDGLVGTERQLCPMPLQCTDVDTIVVPQTFSCVCPACGDVMMDTSTSTAMKAYLESKGGLRRHVTATLSRVREQEAAGTGESCPVSRAGCTDPMAVNYDPFAASDDGTCIAKVLGCPATATATNAAAVVGSNFYEHADAATQCRGVYCSSDGSQAGITTEVPSRDGAAWACNSGSVVFYGDGAGSGELPPIDECITDPCNAPASLADALAAAASGAPATYYACDQLEIGDLPRAWVCNDPNQYWRGDYTCSCAFDSTTTDYDPAIQETCGADVLVISDSGTVFSQYEAVSLMARDPIFRRHVCQVSTGELQCVFPNSVYLPTHTPGYGR